MKPSDLPSSQRSTPQGISFGHISYLELLVHPSYLRMKAVAQPAPRPSVSL